MRRAVHGPSGGAGPERVMASIRSSGTHSRPRLRRDCRRIQRVDPLGDPAVGDAAAAGREGLAGGTGQAEVGRAGEVRTARRAERPRPGCGGAGAANRAPPRSGPPQFVRSRAGQSWEVIQDRPRAAAAQCLRTGQTTQSGLRFRQTKAPSSIIAWLWSPGDSRSSSRSAVSPKGFDRFAARS